MKYSKIKQSKKVIMLICAVGICFQACSSGAQKESDQGAIKAPKQSILEAVFMGSLSTVEKHIKAGTDLNQKDDYGSTPLAIAATFGKADIAKALINGGADLEMKGADGSTALHTAAFFGRTEIVKSLLGKEVNIDVRNNYGSTALESVQVPFEQMKPMYDQISRDLGPLGLKLDYSKLAKARKEIATLIANHQ